MVTRVQCNFDTALGLPAGTRGLSFAGHLEANGGTDCLLIRQSAALACSSYQQPGPLRTRITARKQACRWPLYCSAGERGDV